MGMVFGKINVETPKHETIKSTPDYEVRKYPPSVIAQVTYSPAEFKGDRDGGFTLLANYIGALGAPQNAAPETAIAMTAPVVTKKAEAIAMTAPVVTKKAEEAEAVTMQFLLPAKYRTVEEAPRPVDERVVITAEGERVYAVVKFGGVATEEAVAGRVGKLREWVERDGYKIVGEFSLARYNPPWTLPPFRTNEVFLPVALE